MLWKQICMQWKLFWNSPLNIILLLIIHIVDTKSTKGQGMVKYELYEKQFHIIYI